MCSPHGEKQIILRYAMRTLMRITGISMESMGKEYGYELAEFLKLIWTRGDNLMVGREMSEAISGVMECFFDRNVCKTII